MKRDVTIVRQQIYRYIFRSIGGIYIMIGFVPSLSFSQFGDEQFPYMIQGQTHQVQEGETTDFATGLLTPDIQDDESIIQTLSRFFRVTDTQYYDDTTTSPATNYIKRLLNMLLGLVSFLALVMVIFAFYLIFFSKGEEAVTKARKILIGVAIALAIM